MSRRLCYTKGMSNNALVLIIISLIVVIIAITVHEFMHGLTGYWLGDDTAMRSGRLSLNPLAHIDPFTTVALPIILVLLRLPPFGAARPVPIDTRKLRYDEFGMAMVAVAGPISNLLLAIIGGVVLRVTGAMDSTIWVTWWLLFISINIGFFVFNLIPFPPLDGSRILYAFAPEPLQKIMIQIESFGFMAIVVFMFLIFPLVSPILQSANQSIINLVIGS